MSAEIDPRQPSSDPGPKLPEPPPQRPFRSSHSWRFLKIGGSWLLALLIAFAIQRFAFQSYQVFGQSMEPTLSEGDYLIISKLGATFAKLKHDDYVPTRGDIVVLDSSLSGNRLIKRVIGLPGERITITGGGIKIFNQEHPEGFDPYEALGLPQRFTAGQLTTLIPTSHVYVIGDNRQAGGSLDSRNELGPVPTDQIIGKLAVRLWPLSQPRHR